jgi:HAD superfamily hydrolase (TIGR01509 family)
MSLMLKAVLFDVDGTLVDSNDAHAQAWVRAFAEHGVTVSFDEVRRSIGMGGDKLMPRVSPVTEESEEGARIAERRKEIFKREFMPHLQAQRGAGELVAAVKRLGFTAVAASSAKKEELEPLLKVAGADTLIDHSTSSDDAEESKPDPDIITAALERAGASPDEAIMIGDTPYDVESARRAGVRTIAFRCGGWQDADLEGAIAIYDGPWDLLEQLVGADHGRPLQTLMEGAALPAQEDSHATTPARRRKNP